MDHDGPTAVPSLSVRDLHQNEQSFSTAPIGKTASGTQQSRRRASQSRGRVVAANQKQFNEDLKKIQARLQAMAASKQFSRKGSLLLKGVPRHERLAAAAQDDMPTPTGSSTTPQGVSPGASVNQSSFLGDSRSGGPLSSRRCRRRTQYGSPELEKQVAAMRAHLRAFSITGPMTLAKIQGDLRLVLNREFRKLHFATLMFLKRRAELDLSMARKKRQDAFAAEVKATAELVRRWEDGTRELSSAPGDDAPRLLVGRNSSHRLSISARDQSMRRTDVGSPASPGSPLSDFGTCAAPSTFNSVVDTLAVIRRPYDGPVVSQAYRQSIRAVGRMSPPDSPAQRRASRSSLTPGTVILSPIAREANESSLNSTLRSNRGRKLQPLQPATVHGVPAKRLESTSLYLESERKKHQSAQREIAKADPAVGFWLGSSNDCTNHITRPTASSKIHSTSLTLTYFDEKGQIDGRDGVAEMPISRAYGASLTTEQFAAARKAAMQAERRRAHEHSVALGRGLPAEEPHHAADSNGALLSSRSEHPSSAPKAVAGGLQGLYQGPSHAAGNRREVPPPSESRISELLSTVFVRGGDVAAYIKEMHREANRRDAKSDKTGGAVKRRLGGVSTPRHLL
jgi:hypothetical protein